MYHRTQIKIVLIMSAIALMMLAGLYAVKKSDQNKIATLLSHQQSAQEALLDKIIELKSKSVKNFANDYTYWDDMVAFVKSGDPVWAEENMEASMPNLGVDVAWVYRPDLSVMYSSNGFDADHLNQLPLSADILGKIVAKGPLSHFFLLIDAGLLEIFSASIHPTNDPERKTPPQGYLFVGCLWSEAYLKDMSRLMATDISLAIPEEAGSETKRENFEKFIIICTKALTGWDGTPIINVLSASEAAIPKTMQKHLDAQYLNILAFLVFLLIVLLLILFRLISRPLNLLTQSMADGNPKIIEGLISQKNEFGNLALMISEFFNQKNHLEKQITERKQAEENLRMSEVRLRAILNATPFPIALVDIQDDKIEFWSRSALDLFGHTAATAAEWYLIAYPDPDYRRDVIERWKPFLETARLSGQAVNAGEYRITCRDGSVRTCELYAAFLADRLIVTFNDITERKHAEKALLENEEKYRTLVTKSPDGIFIVDLAGAFISVNKTMCDNLKYSEEEFLSMKMWDIVPPKYLALHGARLAAIMKGESKKEAADYEVIGKDGITHFIEVLSAPYYKDQEIIGFQGIARDVTERRLTEEKLRESEKNYKELINGMAETVWVIDFSGNIIEVNDAAVKVLGYTRAELLKIGLFGIDTALKKENFHALVKSMSSDKLQIFEALNTTKDGKTFPVEVYTSLVNYQGKQAILGIARDITERKQAEKKMRESDERMSDIINSSSDWVWEVDEKGRYTYSSEKGYDLLGYTDKEIIGKTPFDFMAPEEAERLKTIFSEIISKKELIKDLENWNIRKNGDRVCHLTNGVPVLDVNGNVKGYRGVDKDITDRKRAEEELHAASVRQEAVLAAVPDILMEVNNDKVYTWTNPAGLAFFGEDVIGKEAAFYFEGEQETYGRLMPLFNGNEEMIYLESWQRRKDGEKRLLAWRCQGLKDTHGNVVGAISSAHDITEQKQAEESLHKSNEILQSEIAERLRVEEELRGTIDRAERSRRSMLSTLEDQRRAGVALRTSEERYRGIFENVQDAYYEAALDGTILEISPSIAILSHGQYHREEVLGRSMNEFYTDPERRGVLLAALREQGAVGDFEIDLRNKDGVLIPCSITSSIRIDATSHEKKIVGSIRDISERKRAQIQMLKDLRTKETLLQELYHRTKNNMQVISSMLHLYGRRISGHEARELFGNIEMKIRSMALVHQKLYESVDLSHVDLKDYFHTLIALLKQSNPNFNAVVVHEELEDVKVLIDTAVPLGMVVSELISNMVKHAFPDKRKAEMKIRLSQTKENTVVLEISDNGVGFAEGFDYRTQANLGLDTVIGLVEDQLNGKITFTSKKGLHCRIALKEEQYQVRI